MSRLVYDTPSAIDAIYSIANAAITSSPVQDIATLTDIRYPGDEATEPTGYFAAVSYQMVVEAQSSLGSNVGGPGTRQWQSTGLLYVQVFCPKSDVKAVDNGLLIGSIIRDAYRKPVADGSIWFRNQQLKPMIFQSKQYQFNIVVTFEYQTIV